VAIGEFVSLKLWRFCGTSVATLSLYISEALVLTQKKYLVNALSLLAALSGCAELETSPDGFYSVQRSRIIENSPSPSFGDDGLLVVDGVGMKVQVVRVQRDSKIIVGGYGVDGAMGKNFIIARLDQYGVPDVSFGDYGRVSTHFGYGDDVLNDLQIAADGSIIAVGRARGPVNDDLALAKYSPSGQLDASFGNGGLVLRDLQPGFAGTYDNGAALLFQGPDKFVVVGETHGNCKNVVARFMSNGIPDVSFGRSGTGIEIIRFSGNHDTLDALAFGPMGEIIAAGTIAQGRDFGLVRLSRDGIVDMTYGTSGRAYLNMNAVDQVKAVAVRPNGHVVVAGYTGSATNQSMVVFELDERGLLDLTWGNQGKFLFKRDTAAGLDRILDAELLGDGSLIAVGQSSLGGLISASALKLTPMGALDASFGTAGMVISSYDPMENESAQAIALRDGKLIISGNSKLPDLDLMIVRQMDLAGKMIR
jgi:uncharacterized delta-60 repeat protein